MALFPDTDEYPGRILSGLWPIFLQYPDTLISSGDLVDGPEDRGFELQINRHASISDLEQPDRLYRVQIS